MQQHKPLLSKSALSHSQLNALKQWISNGCFEEYESPDYVLSHKGRPRNRLYRFALSDINCPVVMKVSYIHRHYKWTRRFELVLKHYLRDANRNAFHCCQKAHRLNLAAPRPLAYWRERESLTQVKSYFLYEYLETAVSWYKLCENLKQSTDSQSQQQRELIKQKIIAALAQLHQAGIRHGDPIAQNTLISTQDAERLADAKVYFIDYDGGTCTKIKHPVFIRRFFDLRDLRKLYIDDASPYDVLNLYLGGKSHPVWRAVLSFWRWGGFNPLQWHNPKTRRGKKHLK